MATSLTSLTTPEDFDLLMEGRDIVSVNGRPSLYTGKDDSGNPTFIYRVSENTISEIVVNNSKLTLTDKGSVRAIGEGALVSLRQFANQGMQVETLRGDAYRNAVREYDLRDKMLEEATV